MKEPGEEKVENVVLGEISRGEQQGFAVFQQGLPGSKARLLCEPIAIGVD